MSLTFSQRCKNEIISANRGNPCCQASYLYGMICFARRFSRESISFTVKSDAVLDGIRSAFLNCGISEDVIEIKTLSRDRAITITDENATDRLLYDYGYLGDEASFRLKRENFMCDACAWSFLAGAFLVGGTVTDPNVNYHLEFANYRNLFAHDFFDLLGELGFSPKTSKRYYSNIIYFKDSTQIEDMLTAMGAPECSMELMSTKMLHDVKNQVNRRMNCDNANIDKALAASEDVRRDIEYIMRLGEGKRLGNSLYTIATLRYDNPELSLSELGELMDPKLTKSGVSHRLARIKELACELREENAKQ